MRILVLTEFGADCIQRFAVLQMAFYIRVGYPFHGGIINLQTLDNQFHCVRGVDYNNY